MDPKVLSVAITAGLLLFGAGGAWYTMDGRVIVVEDTQQGILEYLSYEKCIRDCKATCEDNGIPLDQCHCPRCDRLREKIDDG